MGPDSACDGENGPSPGFPAVTWLAPHPPPELTPPPTLIKNLKASLDRKGCQKLSWCVHWRGSVRTRPTCGSAVGAGSIAGFLHKSFHTQPVHDLIRGHRGGSFCSDSPPRRRELARPLRTAPLLQSCRIMKHGAAHTLLSKGHFQHSRVPGYSDTPSGHHAAGSALRYTHLLPRFFLHQFSLQFRSNLWRFFCCFAWIPHSNWRGNLSAWWVI